MSKVTVKICSGTTCFVMGSNQLSDVIDTIKKTYKDDVDISWSNCLNQCSTSHSKAPFVKINDDFLSEVTPEKLISEIKKRVENDK